MNVTKAKLLVWIVVVGCAALWWRAQTYQLTDRASISTLKFYFESPVPLEFSTSPRDIDLQQNDRFISSVVGTLLRMNTREVLEPYLAESYHVEEDGHAWIFEFRKGLIAANGTNLTAKGYVESFERLARYYLKNGGSVPYFDGLEGWSEFVNGGHHIRGLSAEGQTLVFRFRNRPENYPIIYAVPMFGYYLEADFVNGDWRSIQSLTSTSSYEIEQIEKNRVLLKKRTNWPLALKGSYDKVLLQGSSAPLAGNFPPTIIKLDPHTKPSDPNYRTVLGKPEWTVSFVLNPKTTPMISKGQRNQILKIWVQNHRENGFETKRSRSSPKPNYLDSYKAVEIPAPSESAERENIDIDVGISFELEPAERDFITSMFTQVLELTGINFKFKVIDQSQILDWVHDKVTPARIAKVVAGSHAHNMNNQIMYATKSGISFPDPSGRITKLIQTYIENEKSIDQEYLDLFNRFLLEDTAVLPLFHRTNVYLISKDIEPDKIPSDVDNSSLAIFEQ